MTDGDDFQNILKASKHDNGEKEMESIFYKRYNFMKNIYEEQLRALANKFTVRCSVYALT